MRKSISLIIILLASINLFSQSNLSGKIVDTEPIELYLALTNSIKKKGNPDETCLRKYFSNPTVTFFKQRPNFDSLKFINSLIAIYTGKTSELQDNDKDSDFDLMLKYKENESIIEKGILRVKTADINGMVNKRLKPFYPSDFNIASQSLHFIYLFLDEGNGGIPGYVFNSALQTAWLGNEDIDIISAHEAYHSITNSIFLNKFMHVFEGLPNDTLANSQNLLMYLEIVAEEGIADLIDKDILSSKNSPLSKQIKILTQNEQHRAEDKIRQLDSLLRNDKQTLNFLDLRNILENGGHIPGRYMAKKIKIANLLNEYISETGNPFKFIYLYNEAVKDQVATPRFSETSISNLKMLEKKLRGM